MTHLSYWRIRRFEIISISVVWRILGINESFLEDMTSRLFNRVSFKSHISHFPKWDFYRGVWLLSDLLVSNKYSLLAALVVRVGFGSFLGNAQIKLIKAQQELVLDRVQPV